MIGILRRVAARRHVHITIHVRIPEDQLDGLFDAVANATHHPDEEVICSGPIRDPSWGIYYGMEVVGYRLPPHAAEALHLRILDAIRTYRPLPAEARVTIDDRCRCS